MERSKNDDPRLLLIDMTPIGGSAATSTLKKAYFEGWRDDALLHVQAADGGVAIAAGAGAPRGLAPGDDRARALIAAFRPEVILYRPVPDHAPLHRFAMEIMDLSPAPLVMWIMDDWPERLRDRDPEHFAVMDGDLRALFARAAANFAISDSMANAFADRYGVAFDVAHNGVVPADWPTRRRPDGGPVLVRYAGSLAPDMALDSVLAVARAVSYLAAQGRSIRFEGRTQTHWYDAFADAFKKLPSVSMRPATMSMKVYRQWLADADLILVAYNFDAATRRYIRYSFANKTPEALAAGAAILAFGPAELETIAFFSRCGAAAAITDNDPDALEAAIAALADDAGRRKAMGAAGRALASSAFDLDRLSGRMRRALYAAARRSDATGAGAAATVDALAEPPPGPYRRAAGWLWRTHPRIARTMRAAAAPLLNARRRRSDTRPSSILKDS